MVMMRASRMYWAAPVFLDEAHAATVHLYAVPGDALGVLGFQPFTTGVSSSRRRWLAARTSASGWLLARSMQPAT